MLCSRACGQVSYECCYYYNSGFFLACFTTNDGINLVKYGIFLFKKTLYQSYSIEKVFLTLLNAKTARNHKTKHLSKEPLLKRKARYGLTASFR